MQLPYIVSQQPNEKGAISTQLTYKETEAQYTSQVAQGQLANLQRAMIQTHAPNCHATLPPKRLEKLHQSSSSSLHQVVKGGKPGSIAVHCW